MDTTDSKSASAEEATTHPSSGTRNREGMTAPAPDVRRGGTPLALRRGTYTFVNCISLVAAVGAAEATAPSAGIPHGSPLLIFGFPLLALVLLRRAPRRSADATGVPRDGAYARRFDGRCGHHRSRRRRRVRSTGAPCPADHALLALRGARAESRDEHRSTACVRGRCSVAAGDDSDRWRGTRVDSSVARRLQERRTPGWSRSASSTRIRSERGRRRPAAGARRRAGTSARRAPSTAIEHVIVTFSTAPHRRPAGARRDRCASYGVPVSLVPRLFEVGGERVHRGRAPGRRCRSSGASPSTRTVAVPRQVRRSTGSSPADRADRALLADSRAVAARGADSSARRSSTASGGWAATDATSTMLKFRTMQGPSVTSRPRRTPSWAVGSSDTGTRRDRRGRDRTTRVRRASCGALARRAAPAVNVLRGEMSLVGPRPERPIYAELFERRSSTATATATA